MRIVPSVSVTSAKTVKRYDKRLLATARELQMANGHWTNNDRRRLSHRHRQNHTKHLINVSITARQGRISRGRHLELPSSSNEGRTRNAYKIRYDEPRRRYCVIRVAAQLVKGLGSPTVVDDYVNVAANFILSIHP